MWRRRFVDFLVYLAVRLLICIVQALRLETGQRIGNALAWLFCEVLAIRRGVVDENLAHAFPELSPSARRRLARQMWEHLFQMVLETAHTKRKIHDSNWRQYVRLKDAAPLVRALCDRRPVLIVSGHLGNFEVGGYVLGILGFPTFTVARTLDNPYLDRFLNRFRGGTGQRIVPKSGGYEQIVEALDRGHTMLLLADQYAGPKGAWVEFFGRPASAHKAIALLALEHNAWLSVCVVRRLGRPMKFEFDCSALIDPHAVGNSVRTIHELTQWYTTRLEEFIRIAPDQYWWLHRRWKDPRQKKRRLAQVA